MSGIPVDKDPNRSAYSRELEFLSQTAAELFDILPEQNIYEVIGNRLKEIVGNAIVMITEYDKDTCLFHVKCLKGTGGFTGSIIKLLKKNPKEITVRIDDPEAMKMLLTGKMVNGPEGLYELSFKAIPKPVCQAIEKLLDIGIIYVMGFVCRGELFGDAVIICRQGENQALITKRILLIETFINQAALALHRKRAEAALHTGERRFKELIKNSSDSITILDKDGMQVFVSDVVEPMLGYHPSELMNIPVIKEMIHPEDRDHTQAAFLKIIQEGQGSVQYRHRHKNGSWVYLEAWGTNQLDNPDIRGIVVNVRDISGRKQIEDALRKSEEIHRKFIDHAPIGMFMSNLSGEFTYSNKKLEEITGYTKKEWLCKTYHSIVYPDDMEFVQNKIKSRQEGKTDTDSYEIRIFNSKNEIRWIRVTSESVFEDVKGSKKITGTQSFIEDITQVKRAGHITKTLFAISNAVTVTENLADLYQQIHHLLGEVFDVTNFFIAIVDTKQKTLYFPYYVDTKDDDFSSIKNFNEKESLSGLIVSQQKPILLKKQELEKRAAKKGVWGPVPLIWMGVPLMIGDEVTGVIAVQSYTDAGLYNEEDLQILSSVSDQLAIAIERKLTEEALRKSEALFKLITENTSALVSIFDSNADYVFASPSHEQLGFKPEELMGKSGFTMMVEEDIGPLLKHLDNAKKREASKAFLNYRLKDKTGSIHYFSGSFDAVFKPDGSLEKIICIGEDITELREAQSEKMEALSLAAKAEKLALVGQIAGKIAHDFNNILGVVMGNAELALLDCPHQSTKKTLELIFEQTLRGKNLTKNLVAFARDQEPRQEFFPIDEKMELVINLLRKDLEGIHVVRQYGDDVPELLADPGMMEHAIVNLVQNSIHAVSLVERPEIIIRTCHGGEFIYLEIEDNGCGIPHEFLSEIYEPFFTLKGSKDKAGMYKPGIKGTGYGMSNVKKYVEQHKGTISVYSELKKGTKVVITLPITQKELTAEEIKEVKKEPVCFRTYILLVEDEPAISDIQYRILTQEPFHHKVDIAGNAQVAIDLLNRNTYDLISLDYLLPGELNGMDIYHHIRGKNKTVPIVFISGNIEFLESIKDLKQKDPYIDHLPKPCKNMEYISCINNLLIK
ncbi:MAG: hypothetical protein A2277_00340 [Desulfobacterales bacterium RIFOXYA12_FULL_46_15]|nr:MAG: hypothetical protein A2277_00340 [Desulfobacterales bacterium RIFOXYA12_FULL_46_15]